MNLSLSSPVSRPTKLRSTLAFVSAASILLGSLSLASAQAALPAPQPAAAPVEPASASTTSPAPVAPTLIVDQPAPAAEPAPVLKPPAPLASTTPAPNTPRVSVRPYGILWSSVIATQPVQSYGQPNASAPTSALNPAIYAHPHDGLLSFQVQQTRVGLAVGEGSPFKGTLEIDFIHFDQASPLAQAYPRIRIALLEWSFRENQKVFAGQTWDLFGDATGPQLLSHSFNLVGTLFQAGNIGFMRQQVGWSGRFGNIELSAAAGLQGANTGPTFNNIEEAAVPTFAGRVMYHLPGALGVVGVSGIGTSLRFTQGTNIEHRGAGGGQMFADITVGPLNLHSEIYATQNLANTGALNLAQGRYGKNMSDAGGYLSGKLTFGKHAVTAMYGVAMVLNPSNLAPGYTPAGMTGMTVVPAVTNTAAGPGMRWNTTAHVGYWYSPVKGLSIVAEPYVYATRFTLAAADVGNVDSKNVAWGGMAGAMYQF